MATHITIPMARLIELETAEHERDILRTENAKLAREAHTWWTACRDATGEVERLREVAARMVAGIDHLAELARQWEPDHSSGADRRGWVLAKDARDDAWRLLQEHAQRIGPNARVEAQPHTKGPR